MKPFVAFISPGKAMRRLSEGRHPARPSALLVIFTGLLYGFASAVLALAGAVPAAPVFFGLDSDNYYFWQMVFALPWALAAWLAASVILRVLGGRRKNGGGFAGAAALAGGAMAAPLLLAWVPSAVEAVFLALGMAQEEWVALLSAPGAWQTAYFIVYAIAAALTLRNFWLAAVIRRNGPGGRAAAGGLAAAAVVIAAFIAFIR